MLTEAYQVWRSLDAAGVGLPAVHPRVYVPGTTSGPCLRVRLDSSGAIACIEDMTADERSGLWAVGRTSDGGFPVAKLAQPLLAVPGGVESETLWERLLNGRRSKDRRERLTLLEEVSAFGADATQSKKVVDLLRRGVTKAEELLVCVVGNTPPAAILLEFARSYIAGPSKLLAGPDPQLLLIEIARAGIASAQSGRLTDVDALELLLVGKGPRLAGGPSPDSGVQLAFDVSDDHRFRRRLHSRQVRDYVIGVLPPEPTGKHRGTPSAGARPAGCAYTGPTADIQDSAFPAVRLPGVAEGGVPLVSMFSEAACNHRYGLTDSRVVPVARAVALQVAASMRWITDAGRKNRTWRLVASGKFTMGSRGKIEKRDLLIVYLNEVPDVRPDIAPLVAGDPDAPLDQYDRDARTVCDALNAEMHAHPHCRLNLLLLRQVSKGQVHVALSESFGLNEVIRAVSRWREGATNVPLLSLPFPVGKGVPPVWRSPAPLHPEQVVRLMAEDWVSSGKRANKVEGVSLGEVLRIFLERASYLETTQSVLGLTLRRTTPLLLGVFDAVHRADWDDYSTNARMTALRALATLGILLNVLGSPKENYMKESPFMIGQLLALADVLHRDYCVVVRDEALPPTLVGNAMMGAALENPVAALAQLAERIRVYIAWAETAKEPPKGEDKKAKNKRIAFFEAKKTLLRYQPLAARIHELGIPDASSDLMRAHLLLGYLASPKYDSTDTGEENE